MQRTNKKGQSNLRNLAASILLFVVIGFVAAGGVIGLNEIKVSDFSVDGNNVNEENVTRAGARLSPQFTAHPYRLTSVTAIRNTSGVGETVLTTALYNVTTGDGGFIVLAPNVTATVYNVSYTYDANRVTANVSRNSELGVVNTTDLFGVIGILLGVGALLFIVIRFAPGVRLGRGE